MKNKSLFKMPTTQDNVKRSSSAFDVDHDANSPQTRSEQHLEQPSIHKSASTESVSDAQGDSSEKVSGLQKGTSPESVRKETTATTVLGTTSEPFAAVYEEVDETDDKSVGGRVEGNERSKPEGGQSSESKATADTKGNLVNDSVKGLEHTPSNSHSAGAGSGGGSSTGAASTDSPSVKSEQNQNSLGANDTTNSGEVTVKNDESESISQIDETSSRKDDKETKPDGSQMTESTKGASVSTNSEKKDSKLSNSGASTMKTPTKGTNEKQGTPRQSRIDLPQKPKRTPSASSKSPRSTAETRIPRALMERHHKTDANEGNKNQKNAASKGAASENPAESKTTDSKLESKNPNKPSSVKDSKSSKTNSIQPADTKDSKPAGPKNSVDSPATAKPADKPGSATQLPPLTKPGSRDSVKPANGAIRSGALLTKDDQQAAKKDGDSEQQQDQEAKAHGIFGKAVMRRLTSLDKTQAANSQSIDLNSSLNSSTGARSLNSSTSSGMPAHHPHGRLAHKTQSMQSLAVPGSTAIGPTPMEVDDKVSLGSRRDSVRHSTDSGSRKSVDYRLQASQAVVAAGPGGGTEEKPKSLMLHDDSMIRAAIPALPLPLAVLCLVLNIFLPGSGTVVSGLSVLCCGRPRISSKGDAVSTTVCVNLFVGAAQLATVTFLLVGWFWSLAWGVKMVIIAVEDREEQRQQREKELQTLALRAFGSQGNPLRARSGNPLV